MQVTIWDLDYYYATNKKNVFNPDAMKVSSYHKQLGDQINFVECDDDINRPYDLYYIFKNNSKLPNPPAKFFLDRKVRWWGKAVKQRINWKMSDEMLGCRPDYLLYPSKSTVLERSEQVRLFNNKAEPLQWIQDWTNTFGNKTLIVTDPYIWCATKENIIRALDYLAQFKKVEFFEPIWIQKIISDQDIEEKFLALNFSKGTHFKWSLVNMTQMENVTAFIAKLSQRTKSDLGTFVIDYRSKDRASHWESKEVALEDFANIRKWAIYAKENNFYIEIKMPTSRFDTPYFVLFENLALWTQVNFKRSWLEFITYHAGHAGYGFQETYWCNPQKWTPLFRDLLLQTYKYPEFILKKWKNTQISELSVPWELWAKEFIYEI